MATVKITQDLLSRTRKVIDRMSENEVKTFAPTYDQDVRADASHLYHLCTWGEENVPLVNQIPREWLSPIESATVYVECEGYESPLMVHVSGLSRAFRRPHPDRWGGNIAPKCTEQFLQDLPAHMTGRDEILKQVDVAKTAHAIRSKWKKIAEDIESFLDTCSTLNEAIKLFPNIRMYINRDDLERHDRKVERSVKRKEIVENLDMDSLTAAAVASRLSI